jgi:hypothetical protein
LHKKGLIQQQKRLRRSLKSHHHPPTSQKKERLTYYYLSQIENSIIYFLTTQNNPPKGTLASVTRARATVQSAGFLTPTQNSGGAPVIIITVVFNKKPEDNSNLFYLFAVVPEDSSNLSYQNASYKLITGGQ